MKPRIMYIERKDNPAEGHARIGRVTFSQTGKTLYYAGREFQSLRGQGFKANYFDVKTGDHYWISGPKKSGQDTLHGGVIHIDDDVRQEYWAVIRNMPQCVNQKTINCPGKH
jgi:hypothetical protein